MPKRRSLEVVEEEEEDGEGEAGSEGVEESPTWPKVHRRTTSLAEACLRRNKTGLLFEVTKGEAKGWL